MELAVIIESEKDFSQLESDFAAELAKAKYGIMTRVDVRALMAEKGVQFDQDILLLGICNPNHAKRALAAEEDVALMLPCSAVIYGRDRGSTLKIARPQMIASFFDSPDLADLAGKVEADIVAAGNAAA